MKQECDHLRTKALDQTNKEIIMDIKHSNDEINDLKESLEKLKKSHDVLQENHTKMKRSHKELQDDHAEMTQEVKRLKTAQDDVVPWNLRGNIAFIYVDFLFNRKQ